LIVRPLGDAFQILAGHTRAVAAGKAGIKAMTCVVRELDERDAYMLLLLDNEQLGMTNLERGRHFRGSGLGSSEYARLAGVSHSQVTFDGGAAEVYDAVVTQVTAEQGKALRDGWNRHLYTIKTAKVPDWLRVAFVRRMLEAGWNVETTRTHAGRLKDVVEPPTWADRDAIAEALAAGVMKPAMSPP
jgi:ParB-like chromosome segregation protein Spo0J